MYLILLSVFFPILSGLFLLIRYRMPLAKEKKNTDRKTLLTLTGCFLVITVLLCTAARSTAGSVLRLMRWACSSHCFHPSFYHARGSFLLNI